MSDSNKSEPINKQTRKVISLEQKHQIISEYRKGMRMSQIAKHFDLHLSTVYYIIKHADQILTAVKNINSSQPSKTKERVYAMEAALKDWCARKSRCGTLSSKMVKFKANQIYDALGPSHAPGDKCNNFSASESWFRRFRKKSKEYFVVNKETTPSPRQEFTDQLKLKIQHGGFCDETIFNVNETNFYWKKFPKLGEVDDPDNNDSLHLILGTNVAGDCKLKPVVVYHSENPDSLKNNSKAGLPVIWKTNPSSLVTASLFKDWFGHHFVPEVERYCHSQNIPFKVLLIIEMSPAHPRTTLVNFDPRVEIMYLNPELVPIQPMEQGISKSFKAIYLQHLLKAINHCSKTVGSILDAWKSFNMLDAVRAIEKAWSEVSRITINNAWRKVCLELVQKSNIMSTNYLIIDDINDIVDLANKKLKLEVTYDEIDKYLNENDDSVDFLLKNAATTDGNTGEAMTTEQLKEGIDAIEQGIKIFEQIDSNAERVILMRKGVCAAISYYAKRMEKGCKEQTADSSIIKIEVEEPSTSHD